MTISRRARDPVVHLHSFLEHTLTAEEIAERGAHFAELVLGKAEATSVSPHRMKELLMMLVMRRITNTIISSLIDGLCPGDGRPLPTPLRAPQPQPPVAV